MNNGSRLASQAAIRNIRVGFKLDQDQCLLEALLRWIAEVYIEADPFYRQNIPGCRKYQAR